MTTGEAKETEAPWAVRRSEGERKARRSATGTGFVGTASEVRARVSAATARAGVAVASSASSASSSARTDGSTAGRGASVVVVVVVVDAEVGKGGRDMVVLASPGSLGVDGAIRFDEEERRRPSLAFDATVARMGGVAAGGAAAGGGAGVGCATWPIGGPPATVRMGAGVSASTGRLASS